MPCPTLRVAAPVLLGLCLGVQAASCTGPQDPAGDAGALAATRDSGPPQPPVCQVPETSKEWTGADAGFPAPLSPRLGVAQGCADLLRGQREAVVQAMRASLRVNLSRAQELNCAPCWEPQPYQPGNYVDAGTAVVVNPPTNTAPSASSTNVQVEGVDEPDFVKNDDAYLYQLTPAGRLAVVAAWPAASMRVVSEVEVEGQARKLFVAGNRAVVFSAVGASGAQRCTYGYDCEFLGDGQATVVSVFDLSDKAQPRLERRLRVPAGLVSARRIGAAVHLVTVTGEVQAPAFPVWPAGLAWGGYVCGAPRIVRSAAEIEALFAALEAENLAAIDRYFAEWGPSWGAVEEVRFGAQPGQPEVRTTQPLAECAGAYVAGAGQGLSALSLVSFDLGAPGVSVASTYSRPGAVYASAEAVYVAVRRRAWETAGWYPGLASTEATEIHKFRLAGASARYAASGVVEGRVLNQFSLDERDGLLRLATTVGWSPGSRNALSVLEEVDGALVVAGAVPSFGEGEDIRSVRFDGEVGYVVTFRQTDPLFAFDLADPRHPALQGELEIPGFSTYLHRYDATHLLSIGFNGTRTAVMLQLFDVSNLAHPRLLAKEEIGGVRSASAAATDHLAFTFVPSKQLLALPATVCPDYGATPSFNGLVVFRVDPATGFTRLGALSHPEPGSCYTSGWTDSYTDLRRSVVMGDFVYGVGDDLVRVAPLSDLSAPVATIQFGP